MEEETKQPQEQPLEAAEEVQSGPAVETAKEARNWAMFCHLAGLFGYVMPIVGNIVGPLILSLSNMLQLTTPITRIIARIPQYIL